MQKFRQKPVIIEAVQFTSYDKVRDFIGKEILHGVDEEGNIDTVIIDGIDASLNDWIVKDTRGEFYPYSPDMFEKTYEPVEED